MSGSWWHKRSVNYFKKAIETHQLLKDGEKVLIGVSGGVDSMVLTHLFNTYNQRRHKHWDILAVHINPGFPGWKLKPLIKFFDDNKIKYLVSDINIQDKINQVAKNMCYFCSRERRKRLFEIAEQEGIQKIALAHHIEDVNETYFLNLVYSSKTATFVPKQGFFKDKYFLIRPLYYFDKELILQYSKTYDIKKINNRCPFQKKTERNQIRKFLTALEQKNPRIKTNIFWGINNIKYEYLP
jgi:tRNA 2-thiocytidine biosynthesis protein TtcA